MKITLFMAISINGFIAEENGSEDFLSEINWKVFCKLVNKFSFLVWGRKTYENVKSWGPKYLKSLKIKKIILSKNFNSTDKDIIILSSPEEAISYAKKSGAKEIIVSGGASVNSAFMEKGLIDKIIINIEPALLGKGIPLFSESNFKRKLKLIKTQKISSNMIQLHYKVLYDHKQ